MALNKASNSMIEGAPVNVKDFGAVGDGVTDDSSAIVSAITYADTNRKRLVFPAGVYSVGNSGITYSATSIDNLEIYFEAGVELTCPYSGGSYPFLFYFSGVGANVKIIGNGTRLTYSNTPASRGTNHAMYLFGNNATITNLEVSGFVITDSPNFGVAVYAGPTGGVSSGNKDVTIKDIEVIDCKGDGVHVENFDSGVVIDNIIVDNPGDDSVAISNYVGSSGAATKSSATTDVFVSRIHGRDTYSSIVRLLGVQRASITALSGTLGNAFGSVGASAISCDSSGSSDYTVANSDIIASDINVSGGAGIFYYEGGGVLTGLKITDAIQKQGSNYGIRLLQSASAVGTKINNVVIENVHIERASNSGTVGDRPLWAQKVRSLKVNELKVVNAPSVMRIDECERVDIDNVQADSSGSTGTAFDFVTNSSLRLGRLVLDGSCTFATGVTATSNTNVWHTALWGLTGSTSKLSRSGNTGVRGACQRVEASVYVGNVTGGTNQLFSFSENMFTAASYQIQTSLLSDNGLRWGTTGLAAGGFYILYTDTMTGVRVNYVAETNVGF